jgi:hypothetical protein
VAGILFPYRKNTKEIFKTSPAAKYSVGGVPLLAIFGVLGILVSIVYYYDFATIPALGAASVLSASMMLGTIVVSILIYYAAVVYQRRKGIEVAWAFREVPPA